MILSHAFVTLLYTLYLYCTPCNLTAHFVTLLVMLAVGYWLQMATLASLMTRPSSSEQAITVWVWQTAYKLRLHLLDQSDAFVRQTLANPAQGLNLAPDMDSDSQVILTLCHSLLNKSYNTVFHSNFIAVFLLF